MIAVVTLITEEHLFLLEMDVIKAMKQMMCCCYYKSTCPRLALFCSAEEIALGLLRNNCFSRLCLLDRSQNVYSKTINSLILNVGGIC